MNTQGGRNSYRDHIGGFYRSGSNYGKPYLRSGWVWPRVRFPAEPPFARPYIDLQVHPVAVDAMRAIASVLLHERYFHRETIGGTVSMRNITGASSTRIAKQVAEQYPYATSIHAHGCAMDVNPSKNRYGQGTDEIDSTNVPRLWKAIRTVDGYVVNRWGGDWSVDDGMHVECIGCTRAQLLRGIDFGTVVGWSEYLAWAGTPERPPIGGIDEVLGLDIGKIGDDSYKGARAGALQAFLIGEGVDIGEWGPLKDGHDGAAGDDTRRGLATWKQAHGITGGKDAGDGKVGDYEYAEMLRSGAGGGGTVDAYTKAQSDQRYAAKSHGVHGGLTKADADQLYAPKSHPHQATKTEKIEVR